MADYDALVTELREGYRTHQSLPNPIEDDTRQHLIDPVVQHVYDTARIRRGQHSHGGAPDYVLYSRPITTDGPARVIVEAKPLGTDLEKVPRADRTGSPERQIMRYLRDHVAAGPLTIGALTDGQLWRIYGNVEGGRGLLEEIDLGPLLRGAEDATSLRRLCGQLARGDQARGTIGDKSLRALAVAVAEAAATTIADAGKMLALLGATGEPSDPIAPDSLEGRRRDAFEMDWQAHAHADGPEIQPEVEGEPGSFWPRRVRVAMVRMTYREEGIGREEASRAARIFAERADPRTAVLFAWQADPARGISARLVVATPSGVAMTQPFDPQLPPPTARKAAVRLLTLLSRKTVSPRALADALDVLPLQRDFYREIRTWMRGLRHDDAAFRGTSPEGDRHEILLRHLIRILFVWILKEDDFLPPELFDPDFGREHGIIDYHNEVLRFLFHDRLNAEERDHEPHRIPAVNDVFRDVPFLNGSLFAERVGDDRLQIAADRYWSDDEDDSALFNILARYHWTANEHRPGEREQTLDPELLGNLFEQLLADPLIEEKERQRGTETLKAPDGAYYTPMDVAAEMAADALAAAVRDDAPISVKDEELLDLFRSPDAVLPGLEALGLRQRERLQARIQDMRIFDPAVGSGQFLLACLQALRTARRHLGLVERGTTREIITHQLMGQDVNPMAAQIARLRLFIALQLDERDLEGDPLPNLEARIVCADTLYTHPVSHYDPLALRGAGGQRVLTAGADRDQFDAALRALAETRGKWSSDYSEGAKRDRRVQDRAARATLSDLLQAMVLDEDAERELRSLVDYPLLELDHDQPARIDPRLLFAQDEGHWSGFDIVIGNPPYQGFTLSGIGDAERRALEDRGYRAVGALDLYALFCEAALALARPEGGVVVLVTPLSIAFGRDKQELRAVFGRRCRSVVIRSYDNIPDTIFNAHPLFKGWKNRQRSSITTAVLGAGPPVLRTDALLRWRAPDRQSALRRRPRMPLQDADMDYARSQWPRIPNKRVARMIRAVAGQRTTIADLRRQAGNMANPCALSLPKTGWYFVSGLPPGERHDKETLLALPDEEMQLLVIAALNGHVANAWWRVFGDGYHVKPREFDAFTIPDAWLDGEGRDLALSFGRNLISAIPQSLKVKRNAGLEWPNVDFFQQTKLIADLDRFHIKSLGLPAEPLLTQLKLMRSPDGWDFE